MPAHRVHRRTLGFLLCHSLPYSQDRVSPCTGWPAGSPDLPVSSSRHCNQRQCSHATPTTTWGAGDVNSGLYACTASALTHFCFFFSLLTCECVCIARAHRCVGRCTCACVEARTIEVPSLSLGLIPVGWVGPLTEPRALTVLLGWQSAKPMDPAVLTCLSPGVTGLWGGAHLPFMCVLESVLWSSGLHSKFSD